MIEFFQTVMGHRFYEGDVPRITKALERIATCLEKMMENKDADNDRRGAELATQRDR
jgi:hypothetical protein